jgi:hypothetical protein
MSFLNPALFWLGALAIPLIALYLLKLRRKDVRVSSTILWERAVRDMAANAPFQRLRSNLLLLLQLLLLTLLVLALARPTLRRLTSPGHAVVLVIDTSASMGAREVGGTRLEAAKREAMATISRMNDADEAMIVESWSTARVAVGLTRDRALLERTLDSLEPRDTPGNAAEALLLAAGAVEKREGTAIVFLSDGSGATRIPAHPVLEKRLTWVKTGSPAGNAGITAFRAEPISAADGRVPSREAGGRTEYGYSVFTGVANFSASPGKLYVTLKRDGGTVAVRAVELAPGASGGASFEVFLPGEASLEASLDSEDALEADDRAWTRAREPGDVAVQLEGDNRFLEFFMSTRPRVRIVTEKPDLWICAGPAKDPPEGAHAVWFRPDRVVAGITPAEEAARVRVLSWDETHPLLRFARFGDVHVARAAKLSLPADGVNLVQGSAGPLIAAATERGLLRVAVAFRPEESDWPLRPSFPIFFSNVLRAVSEARDAAAPAQVAAGQPARFAAAGTAEATVTDPAGRAYRLAATSAGEFLFGDTHRAGLYTFDGPSGAREFGVNLLSEEESNLAPGEALGSGEVQLQPVEAAGNESRDAWPWLAAAGLLVLLLEWACFHRRIS